MSKMARVLPHLQPSSTFVAKHLITLLQLSNAFFAKAGHNIIFILTRLFETSPVDVGASKHLELAIPANFGVLTTCTSVSVFLTSCNGTVIYQSVHSKQDNIVK